MVKDYIEQPREVMAVYDNKGHTLDNYSIWLLFDDGKSYLITTNAVASIWDIGENNAIDVDALDEQSLFYDKEYHKNTGDEIDWSMLPKELKSVITGYFKEHYSSDY